MMLTLALILLCAGLSSSRNLIKDSGREYEWEMAEVDSNQIREYLIELSKEPHMAGLERDKELAEWMAETWRSAGIDSVSIENYKILLDYPNSTDPNLIRIYNSKNEEVFRSHFKEEGVDHPNFVHAFNAYSKSGTVSGLPLYVNYGSVDDFQLLKNNGTEFKGKVCIARYGKVFRGNIADNAATFGCSAAVIFSDPQQVAAEGTDEEHVYPNDFWIPGKEKKKIQRAAPVRRTVPRIVFSTTMSSQTLPLIILCYQEFLPRIPVQPIGYNDAEQILARLGGDVAPADWQGQIPGLTYRIGGDFNAENLGSKLEVSVHNALEEKDSANVVGVVYGAEEPDRYVMLGNHRDAWGFGALDPSSGTAQLMEVVRVIGEKLKTGWRPKRTLMFLSWGAEEYSLIGSREFVEEYQVQLEDRGVAYINTDVCMAGNYLEPLSSPTLSHLFTDATKDIDSPDGNGSYYDFWKRYEGIPEDEDFEPHVGMSPGAGSDHASFIYLAGIPVIDISFGPDRKKYPSIGGYPAYHTGYETFDLVDKIYDPEFVMFKACAQLNLRLGLELAESSLLPWKLENYADVMESAMSDLESSGVLSQLNSLGIQTSFLNSSVYNFRGSVANWREYVNSLDTSNPLTARVVNDQIRGFEKTFLLNPGLPDRLQYRHAIIAPSKFDAYGGSAFPGIGDLLYGLDELSETDRTAQIKKLKRHISDLMIVVDRAGKYLRPVPTLAPVNSSAASEMRFLTNIYIVFCLIVNKLSFTF
ncbi:N-acetylated-alpha-linked acidic dipeptidase-like protein [Eurytemora carolleeae]|uniref:N-acetylated-alpha-linked acidic dipeptidase-like protein n=1 Tax=Eurytemora carolleeae TaxID=1294199 RepID=UPI000C7712EC|nr:N-acetylated-alpha-linked acidic dipeptidase-like protein [Eurytemora carolleeae]|eukprot:XP_023326545.1 N-acetylated-alpha-linked acidic dipeptidase-like protein [Eurytemora affinis]